MLVVVGLLVLAGIAVALLSGPSAIDRIKAAESCSELLVVYGELQDEGIGDALDFEFQERAQKLDCG